MDLEERRVRAQHLREIVLARDPGDWVDEQIADIRLKRGTREPVG
jgi:trehalose 6-phosphate synthase